MFGLWKNKRAQSTIEYALLIAVVVGAFTAMQLYNRRAINMRVKQGMDRIPLAVLGAAENDPDDPMSLIPAPDDKTWEPILGNRENDTQYEPYYYTGTYDMVTQSTEGLEHSSVGTGSGNRTLGQRTTQRWGEQEVTGTDKATDPVYEKY